MDTFKPLSECGIDELTQHSGEAFPLIISSKDKSIGQFRLDYGFDEVGGARFLTFYLLVPPERLVAASAVDIRQYVDRFSRLKVPAADLVFDAQKKEIRLKADLAQVLRQ